MDNLTRSRLPKYLRQAARDLFETGTFGDGQAVMRDAADEIELLREALWQAKSDLDNAHRVIMPHVHKLAHDAIKVSLIVTPPAAPKEPSDG